MTSEQRYRLRRKFPLLPYLQNQGWRATAYSEGEEVCGKCPLHPDSRPSFYVNRVKDVFYCHGCGQGGDVIRLVQLLKGVDFQGALVSLGWKDESDPQRLWKDACYFYRHQLQGSLDGQAYLASRGIRDRQLIERMGIGYAPGGCLRGYLQGLGYTRSQMFSSRLVDAQGRDCLRGAITFPIAETASMYGRDIDAASARHRFLSRPKGGLYGWEHVRHSDAVIVVEGLFDLASLWQADFENAVALLGSHFLPPQQAQLCDGRVRTVYLCLDADENGSGPRAAQLWTQRLASQRLRLLTVRLPVGYDPNRLFVEGASPAEFSRYLEEAAN
jgi:DNA primase